MKTQLKKSISLFLAVLMILSCWVWVAPEKAEAATNTNCSAVTPSDNYKVTIGYTVSDRLNKSGSYFEMKIWYIPANGTGTPTTGDTRILKTDSQLTVETGTYEFTVDVPGFPYYFEGAVNNKGGFFSQEAHTTLWDTIKIGNSDSIISGGNKYTFSNKYGWSDAKGFCLSGYSKPGGANADSPATVSYEKPAIVGFDSATCTDIGTTEKPFTINKIGGADVSSEAVSISYGNYFDQYGVKWTASSTTLHSSVNLGTPYISTSKGGDPLSGEEADDLYYKDGKVYAKANLQVSAPNPNNGTYTGYIVQKATAKMAGGGDVTSTISGNLTVTYPKYTVAVNGAGSISGLVYTLGLSDGTTTHAEWKQEGYYGASLVNMPDGTGSAKDENGNDAYTFKGLWTEKQPDTGNASYNALEADFATPISSEKFAEYQTDGGTVDGKFITYNDVLYYNAGTQWSTNNKTISTDVTYYGWWLSKDITVKFYNIDGKYLGTETVKYGQTQADITWPTPTESYVSGAYTYDNFNGTWVDINGDTVSQSGCTFTKDLILTPKYDTVGFDKTYTVKFINEADGTNLTGSADYAYRTDLANPNVIPADRTTVPSGIRNDLQYSYTFEGWSAQTPSSGNYHILLEDGDFNEAGTAIAVKTAESDWIVRSDVTYYPVYRRHLRTYAVNFWFKDSTGTEISRKVNIKYGETLVAPTDYVPYTYAQEGYGYEFKNWVYNNASGAEATFGYNNSIVFTKENIAFGLGAVEDGTENVKPVGIRAAYGEPKPTPYTVTFNYKNDKGEDQVTTAEVYHDTLITEDIVKALAPADEYDDGEAMVHFTGDWKLVEGAGKIDDEAVAEGSELSADELLTFSPTSHVTFEAVYGDPQPFYTVTYIDGANTFSERVLQDSDLPAWTTKVINDNGTPDDPDDDTTEDVEYVPSMADTEKGYYTFLGWYDEQQTDTTYAVTNGNKYGGEDGIKKVTSNVTLYPQFRFSPYTYEIKFMSYDGKVQLAAGKYEYGQNIEMLIAEANRAAQTREQDDTYTYSFIGWDKTVPTFCEGKDMTFIAQYKPVYRYYNVKWYNSVLDGENWVADKSTKTEDDKTVETGLLATTKHTYNSKLNSPSVKAECTVTPPEGQSYAFIGWYYNDAEGNAHPYVRGMAVTGEMEFYAVYKLTDKLYTVTTVVGDDTTEYEVAANEKAEAVPTPNAGWVDDEKHNKFDGWVTKDENGTETAFDIANTAITADITIYAKFTESYHDFSNEELVKVPTYYVKGEKKIWCSCDAVETEKTVEIAMLTDTVKPTGTIYLGTQGSWSSTGTPAYETDNQPVSLFANADTDIIITANDTGDVDDLYNASGIGKGIANIKTFAFPGETALTADNYGAALQVATAVFEDETEELNNTANYVIKLGEVLVADLDDEGNAQYDGEGNVKYKNLEDGKTYIIYYYVTDKAGNRLDRLVRTAKFIYDNTAPTFTVEGDSNKDEVAGTPTYCKTATVTGVEVGATLTVNGEAVELTTTSAAGTGSYAITDAGNYLVTVTDKAGNKTSKKFKVAADHSYDVKEVHSTCFADGYKTEVCIVCGDEKEKVVYPTTGHDWEISHVPATCTENGYTYKVCQVCGTEEKIYEVDGELIDPAHDHIYDMADGEIVYTIVTAATCKTKGKEIATCKACGETITREIAIDEDAHNWGATKTLKATCTEAGKTYHTCKLCYISEDLTTIPATGHVETQWVETKAPTCGEAGVETLQCKKCKAYVDGDDEDTEIDTREIPATGRHILAVDEDPTKTFEATADKEGQITRYCTQCGQEWVEKVDKIKKYTVKFVDEDGTTEIKTIADVVSGTTIEKTAVTEPTKANSADGKYKYKFAGWKDEEGNAVTLPIDVTADITLKATYAQSTIIYTHQFKVPDTWVETLSDNDSYVEFAVLMGAMGDSRVPVETPVFVDQNAETDKELKKLYTFEFLGWSTTGAKGDIVTDFTIAGDATFYAVFEAEAIKYDVIYYNGTTFVWNTTVDGGDPAVFEGTIPTKASDETNHYTFDAWYSDATLKTEYKGEAITSLTRLYAGFTATAHTYDKTKGEVTQNATCTLPELTTYTCECGHEITEQTAPEDGHKWNDGVKDETTGITTYTCGVCGATKTDDVETYTVKFVNDNGLTIQTFGAVVHGTKVDFTAAEPTKASDKKNDYTFAGWVDVNDNKYTTAEVEALEITKDWVFEAYYTETAREYRVSYVDVNNKVVQTATGYHYGDKIPAFTGDLSKITKNYDANFHYTFEKWSLSTSDTVTGDMVIAPVFAKVAHDYTETKENPATCDKVGGTVKVCSCGIEQAIGEVIAPLGHTDVKADGTKVTHTVVPATIYKEGSDSYVCTRCGQTITKTLAKLPSQTITITVYDKEGKPAANGAAEVTITNKANPNEKYTTNTDANGQAIFTVAAGQEWNVGITGKTLPDGGYGGTVGTDGNFTAGEESGSDSSGSNCSCSCHKNTFWGILFRFFHKFIKLFTGKIGCCSDPDPRY